MKSTDPDIDRYLLPGLPTERIGARYVATSAPKPSEDLQRWASER
jgi:hypothetical protein